MSLPHVLSPSYTRSIQTKSVCANLLNFGVRIKTPTELKDDNILEVKTMSIFYNYSNFEKLTVILKC